MNILDTSIKLIGVVGCLCIGFSVVQIVQRNNSTITVYGLADKIVTSNKAIVYVKLIKDGKILSEINDQIAKDKPIVYELLRKQGFEDPEISDEGIEIRDRHKHVYYDQHVLPENRYEITHTLKITTKKVDLARKLDAALVNLLKSNIQIETDGKYSYDGDDELRVQLIEEATKDAEKRAKRVAATTGSKILGLRSISTGKFNILNGETNTADGETWASGETKYKKRFRIIVNAIYNKV